jgi:membrane protease YdiL (CAAX protease family)
MEDLYKLNFGKALLITFFFFILQIVIGIIYKFILIYFNYFNNLNLNYFFNYFLNQGIVIFLGHLVTILIILLIYNKNKINLNIKIDFNDLDISFLFFIIPLAISSQIIGSEIENLISIFFKRSLNFYEAIITLAKLPGINGLLLSITLIAVLPAILEELIFRGIIQQGLINKYSATTGILLTSFLFAIVHINPHVLLTIFLLSILLGFVYHIYKNIIYNILIHFFLNLTGLFLIRYDKFQIKGLNTDLSNSSHININLIIMALVIIGLFVYLYLIKFTEHKKNE